MQLQGSGKLTKIGLGNLDLRMAAGTFPGAGGFFWGSSKSSAAKFKRIVTIDLRLFARQLRGESSSMAGACRQWASYTLSTNRGISVGNASGSGTGTIDVTGANTLTYNGVIADNGTGADTLSKIGSATFPRWIEYAEQHQYHRGYVDRGGNPRWNNQFISIGQDRPRCGRDAGNDQCRGCQSRCNFHTRHSNCGNGRSAEWVEAVALGGVMLSVSAPIGVYTGTTGSVYTIVQGSSITGRFANLANNGNIVYANGRCLRSTIPLLRSL